MKYKYFTVLSDDLSHSVTSQKYLLENLHLSRSRCIPWTKTNRIFNCHIYSISSHTPAKCRPRFVYTTFTNRWSCHRGRVRWWQWARSERGSFKNLVKFGASMDDFIKLCMHENFTSNSGFYFFRCWYQLIATEWFMRLHQNMCGGQLASDRSVTVTYRALRCYHYYHNDFVGFLCLDTEATKKCACIQHPLTLIYTYKILVYRNKSILIRQ